MIPPSIVLVFYGLTANVSIGDLFLAVIVPGLLLAGIYLVYILIRCGAQSEPRRRRCRPPRRDIPLAAKFARAQRPDPADGHHLLACSAHLHRRRRGQRGRRDRRRRHDLRRLGARHADLGCCATAAPTMSTCGLLIWLTFGATAMIGVYNLLGGIRFIKRP